MLQVLFPSLFEFGAMSVNYSDVVVRRSHVNANCVIIDARKPVEWFLDHMANKDIEPQCIDSFKLMRNTDNTLSVIEL